MCSFVFTKFRHNIMSSPRFHTKSPSVQHQKPLSSTPKPPNRGVCGTEGFSVGNWEGLELRDVLCGTEGGGSNWGVFGVELRGLWCGTERFFVWNWEIFRAEKEGPSCVDLMCWTEGLWNWGGPEYYIIKILPLSKMIKIVKPEKRHFRLCPHLLFYSSPMSFFVFRIY